MSTLFIKYKLRKIVWQNDFSHHFRKISICYEWSEYNLFYTTDCLIGGWLGRCCASLFGCGRAVQASD